MGKARSTIKYLGEELDPEAKTFPQDKYERPNEKTRNIDGREDISGELTQNENFFSGVGVDRGIVTFFRSGQEGIFSSEAQ